MSFTPEEAALELLKMLAFVEKRKLSLTDHGAIPDRDWLLSTYAECLQVAKGQDINLLGTRG